MNAQPPSTPCLSLETERLRLRALDVGDADFVLRHFSDPQVGELTRTFLAKHGGDQN